MSLIQDIVKLHDEFLAKQGKEHAQGGKIKTGSPPNTVLFIPDDQYAILLEEMRKPENAHLAAQLWGSAFRHHDSAPEFKIVNE